MQESHMNKSLFEESLFQQSTTAYITSADIDRLKTQYCSTQHHNSEHSPYNEKFLMKFKTEIPNINSHKYNCKKIKAINEKDMI